jgi:ABC-type polysaccharide/polyol phosphate transport system ATPase subunit
MWAELMHFVRLRNVTIEFPIYQGPSRSLKKALLTTSIGGRLSRNTGTDRINVRALQDVTLKSKTVTGGIIGPNGLGKRRFSKSWPIMSPVAAASSSGRVTALSTVGLSPDATGQEISSVGCIWIS